MLTQQVWWHQTPIYSSQLEWCRVRCSVGSMRQRGEWSRLAVSGAVCHRHQPPPCVRHWNFPTLSSCHGSSLTRDRCRSSTCITQTTASSLFHPSPARESLGAPALAHDASSKPGTDTTQTTRPVDPALDTESHSAAGNDIVTLTSTMFSTPDNPQTIPNPSDSANDYMGLCLLSVYASLLL